MPKNLLNTFSSRRVLVVGDLILDHYINGSVQRISPEAPVPVLEATTETYKLGGAANVALNLKALGAEVYALGIAGQDNAGKLLLQILAASGIRHHTVLLSENRKTSLKTRMSAGNHQILRVDNEETGEIDKDTEEKLFELFMATIESVDVVVIEDYNKGLLTQGLIGRILGVCKSLNLPVAVDPKRKNFFSYRGVDIFKPNHAELLSNLGIEPTTQAELYEAAQELRKHMEIKYLILTQGAQGMHIISDEGEQNIPTFAREVYDVTGAGDTVISVLALAYADRDDIMLASRLANHAAGVVCGKLGTATCTVDEILASMEARGE